MGYDGHCLLLHRRGVGLVRLIHAPGAYPDIAAEDYHGAVELCPGPSISSTGLKCILGKSPAHFWHGSNLNPNRQVQTEKRHFAVGKASHDIILLGARWPEAYFVLPEHFNARATKEQAVEHAERNDAIDRGLTVLTHDDAQKVEDMAASLLSNPFAAAALTNGDPEMTLAWQDAETGVWLRVRPDFLPHNHRIITDLKFMADGSPEAFSKAIGNFGYHQSAGLYLDGIKAIYGETPAHWLHIVCEKTAPYVTALYELPAEDIEIGRDLNRRAIRLFADCLSSGKFPGYSDDVTQCGLTGWAKKSHSLMLEKEAA